MNINTTNNFYANALRLKADPNVKKIAPKPISSPKPRTHEPVLGPSLFHHHLQKVQQSLQRLQATSEARNSAHHTAEIVPPAEGTLKQKSIQVTLEGLRDSALKTSTQTDKEFHITTFALFTIKQAQNQIKEHLTGLHAF